MKLTEKQACVIYCLQNGWVLITDNEMKGAIVGSKQKEFHIDNGIFFRLVNKGLIYQELGYPFNYILTRLGKETKTKKFDL